MKIIEKLEDLHKQATTDRSHYYVASCCREAIIEIANLGANNQHLMSVIREMCMYLRDAGHTQPADQFMRIANRGPSTQAGRKKT